MFLEIDLLCDIAETDLYSLKIRNIVKKIFPKDLFFFKYKNSEEIIKKQIAYLNETLPLLKYSDISQNNNKMFSFVLLCKYRNGVSHFFYDMISRWLIPNKRLDVSLFFSSNFKLPQIDETFTIAEVKIPLVDDEQVSVIINSISSLEAELKLGVISEYHANRIVEFKGLSSDKKTAMVQEKIGSLIQSRPIEFSKNMLLQMQHFLVNCPDDFKNKRNYQHISKIISGLYSTRKLLLQKIEVEPSKRHFIIKFLKTNIISSNIEKSVLGIIVGLNFLKTREFFEKKHLLKAVNNLIPNTKLVENSSFMDKEEKHSLQSLYLEIEKEDGTDFSFEEMKYLRVALPQNLKSHIEHLIYPVFMPRNDEEIARNILTLSHQLKYVQDIPQIIVSFDKQNGTELSFTVILLRILKPKDPSLEKLILESNTSLKYLPERVKKIGYLRRKYVKEANVFRCLFPIANFLREDHSIDINKARSDLIDELSKIFGDVRDYNGGMISKQNEVYYQLKQSLDSVGRQNGILLEKFFYSVTPGEMTVLLKTEILKNLFLMLLNTIRKWHIITRKDTIEIKQTEKAVYLIVPLFNQNNKQKLQQTVQNMYLPSSEIASFSINYHDTFFNGYVFLCKDEARQKNFIDKIQEVLTFEN
jgi:hypothetical protein